MQKHWQSKEKHGRALTINCLFKSQMFILVYTTSLTRDTYTKILSHFSFSLPVSVRGKFLAWSAARMDCWCIDCPFCLCRRLRVFLLPIVLYIFPEWWSYWNLACIGIYDSGLPNDEAGQDSGHFCVLLLFHCCTSLSGQYTHGHMLAGPDIPLQSHKEQRVSYLALTKRYC